MLTFAIAVAGSIVLYLMARVMIERNSARLREEFRLAMDSLPLQLDVRRGTEEQRAAPPSGGSQDMVEAIAAATAVVGARKVHIRPVNAQPVRAGQDIWAQHGRAGVWSSHDIAQRWR